MVDNKKQNIFLIIFAVTSFVVQLIIFLFLYSDLKEKNTRIIQLENVIKTTRLNAVITKIEELPYLGDLSFQTTYIVRDSIDLVIMNDKIDKVLDVLGYEYKKETSYVDYEPSELKKVRK